jgi:hypothetical protein
VSSGGRIWKVVGEKVKNYERKGKIKRELQFKGETNTKMGESRQNKSKMFHIYQIELCR